MGKRRTKSKRYQGIFMSIILLLGTFLPLMGAQRVEAAIAERIVISQVYGAGGNAGALFTHDFIELYNPTNEDVSLNEWSVQYASSAGSGWATAITPLAGTIKAHGYYLIQQAGGANGSPPPTADVTGGIAMAAASGKVALVNSTKPLTGTQPTEVVDFVGYGTAANGFEGSGPTKNISTTLSAQRQSYSGMGVVPGLGNGWDTDDNGSDFVTATPVPRNTESPAEKFELNETVQPIADRIQFKQKDTEITVTAEAGTVPGDAAVNFYASASKDSGVLATVAAESDGSFKTSFTSGAVLSKLYITATSDKPESQPTVVDVAKATTALGATTLSYFVDNKGNGTLSGNAKSALAKAQINVYPNADAKEAERLTTTALFADTTGAFTTTFTGAPNKVYVTQQNYTATGIMLESTPVEVTKASDELTSIEDVRISDAQGKPVNLNKVFTITGVVTLENGIMGAQKSNLFLQDTTAGINVFGNFDHKQTIHRGDRLQVTGKVIFYNGLTEFEVIDLKKLSEGNALPTPHNVTIADMTTYSIVEPLEGSLATVSGKVTASTLSGAGYNVTIADESGKTTLLRVMTATKIDMETDIVVNKSYTFTGAIGQYTTKATANDGYQLFLRDNKDIAPILGLSHKALTEAYEDANVTFEAIADGAESVTVFYRNIGGSYSELPMSGDSLGRYTAILDHTKITSNEFEYYIEAKAGEKSVFAGSSTKPFKVELVADLAGPSFYAATPANGDKVETPRPEISVLMEDPSGVDVETVEIYLDDKKITDATISATQVKYTPDTDLSINLHTVKVSAKDMKGNESLTEWTFEVVPRFTGGQHYRGTTHNHTNISHDGSGDPEAALKAGKRYGYDYFAFSDHSHDIDPDLLGQDTAVGTVLPEREGGKDWKTTKDLANQYTKDDEYVVFPAFEMTSTTWGHSNVFGTENFIDRNINGKMYQDLSQYYAWVLTNDDIVAQFNHPDMSKDAFDNFKPYDKELDKLFTMIEVGNGSGNYAYANAENKFFAALDLGWHVAPTYGEDNHDATWGKTNARTVIVADELTQESLLHSMRNMRVYMTEDPNFEMDVLANGYYMGSTVDSKTLKFDISGNDLVAESRENDYDYLRAGYQSDDKVKLVELITNGGKVVDTYSPMTKEFNWTPEYTVASGQQWFVVRVTQMDGERAYSAPIWSKEETVDVKVNSIDIVGDVLVAGNPASLKTTVGNFGTQTITDLKVDLYLDEVNEKNLIGTSTIPSIVAKGTGSATIKWDNPTAGDHKMIAVVTSNVGAELGDIQFTLPVHVKQPNGMTVLIDAKHANENSGGDSGTYKDNLKDFILLLQKEGYKVKENTVVITADVLKAVNVFVITHPRTALTADEQKAVADFVKEGGSLLIAGKSNNGSTDSTINNKLLEEIGTEIRASHDGVFDLSKKGNFWGDPLVSPFAVRTYPGLVDNYITDRVPFIDYYSGSSLQGPNNTALTESGKVKFLVRGNDTTYQGNVKNGSHIYQDIPESTGGSVIPLIASDEIGANGRIIVSGMNIFNDKQMDESYEPKGNAQFSLNAVNWLAHQDTKVVDIGAARALPEDTNVVIEGTVTTAAGVFFDAFYLQDETGGIMAFNEVPAGSLKLGDKVRMYGHIITFDKNKEIEFSKFDLDVIKIGQGELVQPKVVETGSATTEINQGLLVKATGKVISISDDGTSYFINDGTGELLVFVDGYIANQSGAIPSMKVGDTLEAVGLSGEFASGSRIRVRDTKELKVTEGAAPTITLAVTPDTLALKVGETGQLEVKATLEFGDGETKDVIVTTGATYSVLDPKVVTVSSSGNVEAVVEGTTTITVTYEKVEATVEVGVTEVDPVPVPTFSVSPNKFFLEIGESQQLVVTNANEQVVTEGVTYASFDEKVATVSDGGKVVAVGVGTATITVTYEGIPVTVEVEVTEVEGEPGPIPTFSVSPNNFSLKIEESQQLVVTDADEQVVTEGVTYASTDEEVATVSGEGNVVAIGVGIATITVSYGDETVEVKVTVTEDGENPGPDPEVVVAISVDKVNLALISGNSTQLKVTQTTTPNDGEATVEDVTTKATYQVENGNIVSVTNGLVTAKAKGTTTITIGYAGKDVTVNVTVTDPVVVDPSPVDPKPETPSEPSKPTPPTPPVDPGKVVVDDKKVADQVNDPKTTKIEVIAPAPTQAKPDVRAEVSAEIMKTIAQSGKALVVKAGAIEVSVPSEVLKAISQTTSGEVTFHVGLAKDAKAPGNGTTLSSVYEFSISAEKDGKTSTIATFKTPVSISIPVNMAAIKDSRKVAAYYVNEAKNTLEYLDGKYTNGKVEFKTNHFSKFVVVENNKTFKDIQTGGIKWVQDYVEVLASKSIIHGKSEDTFAPSDQITRAQFALLLSRALDLPKQAYEGTFSDVTEKMDGSVLEIEAANRAGIVTGNNGKFQPNESITRQQMAAMIIRAIEYKDASILEGVNSKVVFADAASISDYAKEYVGLAAELGIISGREVSGKKAFAPKENATRAHAAKMLYQLLEKF